jgi:hypothetical protein
MRKLTAVACNIAQGSIATYYPEANVLVALQHYDANPDALLQADSGSAARGAEP